MTRTLPASDRRLDVQATDGCKASIETVVPPNTPDSIKRKADRFGVPIIPRLPEHVRKQTNDPNPVTAICGECGMEIRLMMGYVCGRNNCPTGLGGAR